MCDLNHSWSIVIWAVERMNKLSGTSRLRLRRTDLRFRYAGPSNGEFLDGIHFLCRDEHVICMLP